MLNMTLIVRALMTVFRQMAGTRAWRKHLGTAAVVVCFPIALTSLAPAAAYGAEQFGYSVAISGYVFRRMGSTWAEEQKLLPHDGEAGDDFGYSVSIAGDAIIVGAPGTSTGHMYMFDWSGSTWEPYSGNPLSRSGAAIGERVGHSVDVDVVTDGSPSFRWAVAGAPEAIANAQPGAGKLQLVKSNQAPWPPDWNQHIFVEASSPEAGAKLGTSVSVSFSGSNHDGVVFAGQPYEHTSGGGANAGSVMVYEYNSGNGNWGVHQLLVAASQTVGANFGSSVSVAGDLAIVGSPVHSSGQGRAFMIERRGPPCLPCWQSAAFQLLLGSASTADRFGASVSNWGNVAVVGSPGRQAFGRAYVYRPGSVPPNWEQTRELLASGGNPGGKFGQSVAVSGEIVVVGRGNPEAAYVFDLSSAGNPLEGQELLPFVPPPPTPVPSMKWMGITVLGALMVIAAAWMLRGPQSRPSGG